MDFAEDEAACGGLESAGDDEDHILADHFRCVFCDDHGAIIEVTDRLALLFAGFDEFDGKLFAGDHCGFESIGQIVDIQNGHILNLCHAVEPEVCCDNCRGHALGKLDEHLINGFAVDGRFIDRDVESAGSLEPADEVQPASAPGPLEFVARIGEELKLCHDERGDDDRGLDDANVGDIGDAGVYEDG